MNRTVILFTILLAGCCEQAKPVTADPVALYVPEKLPQKAEPTAEEASAVLFKTKVREYLAEARAGAKLLSTAPKPEDSKKKREQLQDLYSHLPDPPKSLDSRGLFASGLRLVYLTYSVGDNDINKAWMLVEKNKSDEADRVLDIDLGKKVKELVRLCDEIEGLLQ